jgi:20S proteasome subunit beta 4
MVQWQKRTQQVLLSCFPPSSASRLLFHHDCGMPVGIRGPDFVMLCSDTSAVQSIVTMKQDEDKLVPIDSHKLFAISGEAGDRVNFTEFITANVRLYAFRNGVDLSTKAVANFTRNELATALRKSPYQTNLLIGGYDEHCGPSLYWCDYLATMHEQNICGSGYGSYFVLSLFDKLWRKDLTEADALSMMRKGTSLLRLFFSFCVSYDVEDTMLL